MNTPSTLTIPEARAQLAPADFRLALRRTMLEHPDLTLKQVARTLGVSRQRVHLMTGPLGRPSCAHPDRPAPRLEEARKKMVELVRRIQGGEPAAKVAKELGISLAQAMKLGFRTKKFRSPHGSEARARGEWGQPGCNCWRCRRAAGVALKRGPKTDTGKRDQILDWLAWSDPDTNQTLTQAAIGALTGVAQPIVSRIARQMEADHV